MKLISKQKSTQTASQSSNDSGSESDGSNSGATRSSTPVLQKWSSVIGSAATFQRSKDEIRAPPKHIKYEPTDSWWRPPLSAWLQQNNREIFVFFIIYNSVIVILAHFTSLCGNHAQFLCSEDWVFHEDKALTGISVGMFLLLAFRTNQAYDRFWEGRKMWGRLREVSRDFARLVMHHVTCVTPEDHEERRRAMDFVIAFAVSLKLQLRGERHILRDLTENEKMKNYVALGLEDIANLQQARHMPLFCQDQLSYYLSKQVAARKLSDYQLGTINTSSLAVMSDTMGSCERIRNTPIPLSYVLQMRFFLILWLLFYPLHTVAMYGWWTLLFANCVSFAVLGIESMSCEIENPFGYDRNDLDLDTICVGLANDVFDIWRRSEHIERDQLFETSSQRGLSISRHGLSSSLTKSHHGQGIGSV